MSIQAGRTIKIIVVDDEPISADDMSDVIRDEFMMIFLLHTRPFGNMQFNIF